MGILEKKKGVIAVLTGGGDVPGLNPAIRALTIRATRNDYQVVGIRKGWAGMINIIPDKDADNSDFFRILDEDMVNKVVNRGGTFLGTSRTNPVKVKQKDVPPHLKDKYTDDINDLTPEVMKVIDHLGIDYLIPIGGDDTLSYGVHMHKHNVPVIAIPKTMDNDVPGTDYCIGFSTCVTRTIDLSHRLRTSAGSHERFLVIEVFGRYAGFTALLPTMAGAANRCVIPEHKFDMEHLTQLMAKDREEGSDKFSVVFVSEGAMLEEGDMIFESGDADAYGHKKLGGIGNIVSSRLKELYPKLKPGKRANVINQKLAYLVRCGDPDAIDSIVPMAYGNLAFDLIEKGQKGRLVNLMNGIYGNTAIDVVASQKKVVDVERYYDTERLRPFYHNFESQPIFCMASG